MAILLQRDGSSGNALKDFNEPCGYETELVTTDSNDPRLRLTRFKIKLVTIIIIKMCCSRKCPHLLMIVC